MDALAKHDSSAVACHSTSTILPAKWLLKYINATSNDNIPIIIEAIETISFYVALSNKAQTAFLKTLKTWKMPLNIDKRIGELTKEVINQEKLLCLISFLSKVSSIELSTICLELFSKVALISKTRPTPSTLSIANFFLEKITDLLFKDSFFLNIKKALLRTPEIAIYGIRVAIASIPLNMDIYAYEIVKELSSSLNSGDEAVTVVISLSTKCSPKIVGQLTNKLFDSVGVAKSVEQRVSLFNRIGGCSSLSQTGEEVNTHEIIQKTAKADKETNEATVSAYWKAAEAWRRQEKMTEDNLASLSLMLKEVSKLSSGLKYIGYGELARIVGTMKLKSLPDDATKSLLLDVDSKDALVLDEKIAADKVVKPATGWDEADRNDENRKVVDGVETIEFSKQPPHFTFAEKNPPLPHSHLTQQYISDKSIDDAIEARSVASSNEDRDSGNKSNPVTLSNPKVYTSLIKGYEDSIDDINKRIATLTEAAKAKNKEKFIWKICVHHNLTCPYFLISAEESEENKKKLKKKFGVSNGTNFYVISFKVDGTHYMQEYDYNLYEESDSIEIEAIFNNLNSNSSTYNGRLNLRKTGGIIQIVEKRLPGK